ncbi:hypothetical protein KAT24_01055 [Candidatus Pacearchaeota archaeon]|nr:hypothetical protein [Candidatus Pacearchaeota archaeon]
MAQVIFKFDKEKDLYNIWETCNKDSSWYDHKKNISSVFLEICEGKNFEECKKELEDYRRKMHNSGLIELFVDCVQKAWNKINDEFFKRLEEITKRKFKFEKVNAYITTVMRCPYDSKEPSFMFSFFRDLSSVLSVCGHELFHIQFHNTYWGEIEEQIGREKTADLKEALTILLNLEFKDLWFVEDRGYDIHKELREFLAIEWKKEKDFEKLLEKCINYLK